MYLTGGQFKGRKIEVPKDVKPTLSKVRESVFNMLQGFEFEEQEDNPEDNEEGIEEYHQE